MRQSNYLFPTLRESPADAEVISHQLMLRAGLIRQLASGVYTYLPLGLKAIRRVQEIVREEMDKAGAQEMLMPAIHPAELWQESGRWDVYGPELMRLKDRHERDFALGPTHEEVVTSLFRDEIKSYKQLPMNVYQIQTKFRDERRPRFGVLRSREFIMKDAYSFDLDEEGLALSYQKMYDAYTAIFTRLGLNFRAVEADSGAIGGTDTHEFMVLSEIGEDTIAYCTECHYAANLEQAEVIQQEYEQLNSKEPLALTKVDTPGTRTIQDLSRFLQVEPKQIIKALAYQVDEQIVLALIRGDYELNEVKLKNIFSASVVQLLPEEEVMNKLASYPGTIGPIGLENVKVVADYSIKGMNDGVLGTNQKDVHYLHAVPERDFEVEGYFDLRNVMEGDQCPRCQGTITFAEGIEVGHVFKLGTKYSEILGATYLDESGKDKPMVMGCYGIGISRTVAAIIEQHHDQDGIIWPLAAAPFQIHLLTANAKNEVQTNLAEQVYQQLIDKGFEVLYDDRNERAGVKFKDADLLGLPIRLTVGKKADEGILECKLRRTGKMEEVKVEQLVKYVQEQVDYLLKNNL